MSRQSAAEALSRVTMFSRLSTAAIKRLAKVCVPRSYAAGDQLLDEGTVGLGMSLVTSGRVQIYKEEPAGRLVLGRVGVGEVLGEMALVDDQLRSASAVAVEPTECLLITRDAFQTLLVDEPEIAWCVVPTMTRRIRELQERLGEAPTPAVSQPAAAKPVGDEEKTGADAGDSVTEETREALVDLIRLQYAALRSGAAAMAGFARVSESFLDTLSRESSLGATRDVERLARRLPRSVLSAARSALRESEDVPQQMVDSFREHLERHPESVPGGDDAK